jgi:hypothetical protein
VCIAQQQQPSFLLAQAAGPTVPHAPSPSCIASSSTYQLTYNFCINSNFEHKLREWGSSLPAWFGIWSLQQPAVSCCLWIQK